MKKTTKLLYLVILAGVAFGAWFAYRRYTESETEKQLRRFRRELERWKVNIRKAIKGELTGEQWSKWKALTPAEEKYNLERLESLALFQIQQTQPELIPNGYMIFYNGDRHVLIQE